MKSLRSSIVASAFSVGLALVPLAAPAASISWSGAQNITGSSSDVVTQGTSVIGAELDGSATTVGTVSFSAVPFDSGTGTFHTPSFTLSGVQIFNQFGTPNYSGNASPFSGLTSSYRTLLTGGAVFGGSATLTLNGLTAGHAYEFEAWTNDSSGDGFTNGVDYSDGLTDMYLAPNQTGALGEIGQFGVGTFTASGTSQVINLDGGEVGMMNAFQLRDLGATAVPEPGTTIFGIAMIGACASGRRRRQPQATA